MWEIFFFFIALCWSLFLLIKSADLAMTCSTRLAESFRLPRYLVGFLVVAVIGILPETFVFVTSALEGVSALGLGTILGSNTADLSLIIALVVLASGRDLKIESRVIKNRFLYLAVMALPLVLGFNGHYSQLEGLTLIIVGILFYVYLLRESRLETCGDKKVFRPRDFILFILGMLGLLLGSYLTVKFGVQLAELLSVSPVLIGLFVIGLGTTLPELLFSLRATKNKCDGLALGDILGTVVADATIVIGVVALINPFSFSPRLIYVTGAFMILAITLLMHYMKTERILTRREAVLLLIFYLIFVAIEILTSPGFTLAGSFDLIK